MNYPQASSKRFHLFARFFFVALLSLALAQFARAQLGPPGPGTVGYSQSTQSVQGDLPFVFSYGLRVTAPNDLPSGTTATISFSVVPRQVPAGDTVDNALNYVSFSPRHLVFTAASQVQTVTITVNAPSSVVGDFSGYCYQIFARGWPSSYETTNYGTAINTGPASTHLSVQVSAPTDSSAVIVAPGDPLPTSSLSIAATGTNGTSAITQMAATLDGTAVTLSTSGLSTANATATGTLTFGAPGVHRVRASATDANGTAYMDTAITIVQFAGGAGTTGDPYQIASAGQLDCVRVLPDSHFILTTAIDLSGVAFDPIGSSAAPFTGTFNGNSHTISNWSGGVAGGLFAVTGVTAQISDLILASASLSTTYSQTTSSGLLVAENHGTIVNCSVTGTITRATTSAGGLVGKNFGFVVDSVSSADVLTAAAAQNLGGVAVGGLVGTNAGVVQRSTASGAITGFNQLGGLVGYNTGSISTSFASGSVTGPSSYNGQDVGGLLGVNSGGFIANSYALAAVTANDHLGGLIGSLQGGSTANSYAAGPVTGFGDGGLIWGGTGTVTSSYWDTQTSGKSGSAFGTGETTANMQTQATFVGWDFTNIWSITSGQYPTLRSDAMLLPTITAQPVSAAVNDGDDVSFSVTATGAGTITYQWRFNGSVIAGETASTLTLSAVAPARAGTYDVLVSNAAGTVASSPATLTVALRPPIITVQPASQSIASGSSATFSVTATGSATLAYQWKKNGTAISGATASSYTIFGVVPADAADYTVTVSNGAGTVTSDAATLTVLVAPAITTSPSSQTIAVGASATFTVVATGNPLNYQWHRNGADIAGATASSLTLSGASAADDGNYTVTVSNSLGSVTSSAATLTVLNPPAITTQPQAQSVEAGTGATFSVTASGDAPSYQWQKDGVAITGATAATFTITSTSASDAGNYAVVVSNPVGSVTSDTASLTVAVPPTITADPQAQNANAGDSVTFTVSATGSPLTYQWQKDGVDITGATEASFTIASVALTDTGSYAVVLSDGFQSITSAAASLVVSAAPTITVQPQGASIDLETSVTFSVSVAAYPAPTYQWKFNGTEIAGATDSSYTIASAQETDAGNYTVVVTNALGSVESDAATLSFDFLLLPDQGVVAAGSAHTLEVNSDETLWAWGSNASGQLGDGTTTDRSSPTYIGAHYARVAAGAAHSLAIRHNGTVWATGSNASGQLGDGTTNSATSFQQVPGLTHMTAIAAGESHSLALKEDGTVWAWGLNTSGQLGDGTTTQHLSPNQVPSLANVTAIAAGRLSNLALTSDGNVWAWGNNASGQLGDGTTTSRRAPVQVANLSNVIAIAEGRTHSLALKADGTVWAWGGNANGQLGDGTTTSETIAEQVAGLSNITAIAAGDNHSLAIDASGVVWAWGRNANGQLGDGTTTQHLTPEAIANASPAYRLAAGGSHSVIIFSTADAGYQTWATGLNTNGQLGNGTTTQRTTAAATTVITAQPVSQIVAANQSVTFSVTTAGSATLTYQWRVQQGGGGPADIAGATSSSFTIASAQTSDAGQYSVVVRDANGVVVGISAWASLDVFLLNVPAGGATAAGGNHSLAIKPDGTLWAWGLNGSGQLGDGTTTNRTSPTLVAALSNAAGVAGGAIHTLAVRTDGTVWAWGDNTSGQLGNGTTTASNTPVQVVGLTWIRAVSAGESHSLALRQDGTVWAWGLNSSGQLGDGTITQRLTPVQVSGLTGIVAISAGRISNLALKNDGTVWAWGNNASSQLGDGTTTGHRTPIQVPNLSNVMAIAEGRTHSVALLGDGTMWAWGGNGNGQLGNGTTSTLSTATQVAGVSGATAIAAGDAHTLAVNGADGSRWAWGKNSNGQLGDGTTTQRLSPVAVASPAGRVSVAVSAGAAHSLVLLDDTTVWGSGLNTSGQLGDTTIAQRTTSVLATVLLTQPATQIVAAGSAATLSVTVADPTVVTFRWNGPGGVISGATSSSTTIASAQTGDAGAYYVEVLDANGTVINTSAVATLTVFANTTPATGVAVVGANHTLTIANDGTVWAWGLNTNGQLGDGTTTSHNAPVRLSGFTSIAGIAGGASHSVAVKTDGTVWAWGLNTNGQLGDGTTTQRTSPVQVSGLSWVTAVSAGEAYSLALRSDGTVWSWGLNSSGQLGDGTITQRLTPVQVTGLTNIVAIAAGRISGLALKSDGTVWAWGNNASGQLGDGTTTARRTAVQAINVSGITAIAAGRTHSLALASNGTVWAWGGNGNGQLGDGTTTSTSTPEQVSGLSNITAISAGDFHSLAVDGSDGTRWAWGKNSNGQLGDGTTTQRTSPVHVTSPSGRTALTVAAGSAHSAVLFNDGTVWTSGLNSSGQIGDGTNTQRTTAVQAIDLVP